MPLQADENRKSVKWVKVLPDADVQNK